MIVGVLAEEVDWISLELGSALWPLRLVQPHVGETEDTLAKTAQMLVSLKVDMKIVF